MADFLKVLLTESKLDTLFVLAGLAFLGIAVVGNISGKISPGRGGRIASGLLGPALIVGGLLMHAQHPSTPATENQPKAADQVVPIPAPTQRSHMGDLEWGKNRQGSDISNFMSGSAEECRQACAKNDACKAMTFVQHTGQAGGVCWLKDSVPTLTDVAHMVSSVKMFD